MASRTSQVERRMVAQSGQGHLGGSERSFSPASEPQTPRVGKTQMGRTDPSSGGRDARSNTMAGRSREQREMARAGTHFHAARLRIQTAPVQPLAARRRLMNECGLRCAVGSKFCFRIGMNSVHSSPAPCHMPRATSCTRATRSTDENREVASRGKMHTCMHTCVHANTHTHIHTNTMYTYRCTHALAYVNT